MKDSDTMLPSCPRVSVIVPVYKVERYLSQCLDSIVGQSLGNIEIICVNDGSPDGSRDILESYRTKDPRIIVIDQSNQGLSAARNNAMNIARGDYIAFVDSDDWLERDALEFLTRKADEGKLDMLSFSGCLVDDRTGEKSYYEYTDFTKTRYDFEARVFSYKDLLGDFFSIWRLPVTAWGTLWKREFLERNELWFPVGLVFEDILFFRMALFKAERISIVNTVFYNYRQREGSITSHKPDYFDSMCEIYARQYHYIATLGLERLCESFVIDEVSSQLNWLFLGTKKEHRKSAYRSLSKISRDIFEKIDLDGIKDHYRYQELMIILTYPTVSSIKFGIWKNKVMAKFAAMEKRGDYCHRQMILEEYVKKYSL